MQENKTQAVEVCLVYFMAAHRSFRDRRRKTNPLFCFEKLSPRILMSPSSCYLLSYLD